MFSQLKNIDTAFQHVKRLAVLVILASVISSCAFGFFCYRLVKNAQDRVHILYNGKVLEAVGGDRKDYLEVELRDHIKTFHQYFFTLSPDDRAIQSRIGKALYLADESAKKQYDNLRESGYYNNLISANISQEVTVDSIRVDASQTPYRFTCYATETLIRASSTLIRKLITQGTVRSLGIQTDNNPHGLLIQQWEILENFDQTKTEQP